MCNLLFSPRGVERLLVGAPLQPGEAVEGEADEGGGEDRSVRDNPEHHGRHPCPVSRDPCYRKVSQSREMAAITV